MFAHVVIKIENWSFYVFVLTIMEEMYKNAYCTGKLALKCEIFVLNSFSEEFVRRSLSASPLMKPFLTPKGWQLEKCVY